MALSVFVFFSAAKGIFCWTWWWTNGLRGSLFQCHMEVCYGLLLFGCPQMLPSIYRLNFHEINHPDLGKPRWIFPFPGDVQCLHREFDLHSHSARLVQPCGSVGLHSCQAEVDPFFGSLAPKKCWKRTFAGSVVDEKPNYFCGIPTSWSMSGCRRKWTWIFTNFKGQSMTKLQHYRPSLLPGMGWASLVHIQAAKTLQDSRVQAPTFQRCFEPRVFCLFFGVPSCFFSHRYRCATMWKTHPLQNMYTTYTICILGLAHGIQTKIDPDDVFASANLLRCQDHFSDHLAGLYRDCFQARNFQGL